MELSATILVDVAAIDASGCVQQLTWDVCLASTSSTSVLFDLQGESFGVIAVRVLPGGGVE
ncbi:hypothetical protein ABZS66_57885 [Dactylosporangium sp. NPDC005572]|uniref:hypothetical protein n=1 Tax=Dactylosporangium sp. NPDC005572 TaxID=3156889 RepID=UPI0033AE1791